MTELELLSAIYELLTYGMGVIAGFQMVFLAMRIIEIVRRKR